MDKDSPRTSPDNNFKQLLMPIPLKEMKSMLNMKRREKNTNTSVAYSLKPEESSPTTYKPPHSSKKVRPMPSISPHPSWLKSELTLLMVLPRSTR